MVGDDEYKAATRRGREMRKNVPHAISAKYDARLNRVMVVLSNRLELALNPELSQALQSATQEQLQEVHIDGAGYHLFFPKLDDGVYVPSLIQGILGSKKWMEEQAAEERRELAAKHKLTTRKEKVRKAA